MKYVMYTLLFLTVIIFAGCETSVLNEHNSVVPTESDWEDFFGDEEMEVIQLASGDVVYKTKDGRYIIEGDI